MKKITKAMSKHADFSNMFVAEIIEDINKGVFDSWVFDPCCVQSYEPYKQALESIVYSIVKSTYTGLASDTINILIGIFDSCPQYIERYLRGMKKVRVYTNFGLNNIDVL